MSTTVERANAIQPSSAGSADEAEGNHRAAWREPDGLAVEPGATPGSPR